MLIEDEELQCPKCESFYLHHARINVFNRSEEDAANGMHVCVRTDDTMTVDRDITENPSGRRNGVTIHLWCEQCDGISVFSLAQHKGQTIMRHEMIPDKNPRQTVVINSRPNPNNPDWEIVQVACPFCDETHTHGRPVAPGGEEHRVADCGKGSYLIK